MRKILDYKTLVMEYRNIIANIAGAMCQKMNCERRLKQLVNNSGPSGIKGIDYTRPVVQTSGYFPSILEMAEEMGRLTYELEEIEKNLIDLNDQKAFIEETIRSLGDPKMQIVMLAIKGYPQWKIAEELNYSQRHIERLVREIKKDVGVMTVS